MHSGPVYPTSHVQFARPVLASGETLLAGHCEHAVGPVLFLYVPAAHGVQSPPSGPEYPALQ